MPSINIGGIKEKITNIIKKIPIPKRKSEDEPTESTTESTTQTTQVQEVENPFEKKGRKLPNLPIKKIIIIAPIVIIVGLLISGIIPIDQLGMSQGNSMSQGDKQDFDFLNERVNVLEEQVEFMLDEGVIEEERGKQGQVGPQGKQGIQGIPGEDGRDGVGGIPVMFSSGSTKTQLIRPLYIGIGGGSENYELIKMISPTDGIIKNLHVLSNEPAYNDLNDNVFAVLVLNGEETELNCNIIKNKCADTETIVKIKAGDMFALKIDKKEQILFGELFRIQASVIMEPDR